MAQSLGCLTLLCTACSTYDASQTSSSTVLQSNITQSNEKPADLEEKEREDLFAYLDSIMKDVIDHKDDPSIEITRIQKNDFSEASPSDLQETFTYTLLTFKDFPGKPPYSMHFRRLLQEDPNAFLPRPLEQIFLNAMHNKNENIRFTVALFPHEFLPGERVTWRISGADGIAFKEATICPRPMIVKDKSGKIILEAALLSIHNSIFSYLIHIPAQDEVVEFISTSGEEVIKEILPLGQSANITYMPAVKGMESGVSQIEIRFLKDGSSYKMQCPWGTALLDYSTVKK